ncbi:MAG: ubiquinone/menaquinone biosynthesis methyltransferase [Puniceicoccales bacterium]|jgi:demethylmenaquinone methyltransferase/2-methoxy-6-polyprenyl-1,4-benzoquinol methylase|nr:ubiquinone/menaquinone biosynthesis methyltransferase [Puniceicoccales bacterium]
MPEGSAIRAMFGKIARRYDLANALLSGGMCRWWAYRLVKMVRRAAPPIGAVAADLATGSGDVAFALARALPQVRVHGFDFCEPMLDVARKKLAGAVGQLDFAFGDCMALPLADGAVDVVTIAYGVRNFQDRARGLREMHRVLRSGGSAFILEFSQPQAWFRPLYYLYLRCILPRFAQLATGNKDAYDYLVGSIARFPGKAALAAELRDAGFADVRVTTLTFGIVAIHHATKAVPSAVSGNNPA